MDMRNHKEGPVNHIDLEALDIPSTVAKRLGVKEKTLEMWRHRGGGPRYCLIGRLVRYRRRDVDEWINNRCVSSTSEAR